MHFYIWHPSRTKSRWASHYATLPMMLVANQKLPKGQFLSQQLDMKKKPNKNQNFSSSTRPNFSMEAFFFTMNDMISNPNILHPSSQNPLSLSSCFFALGMVALLFIVGQAKFPTLGRILVWIGNFALCSGSLFLIAFMHHIFGNILSWLPNRRRDNRAIEGGSDMSSQHHHDQERLGQASPATDIVTLFHMVLMEVLDRVWEDLVMEDGPSPALQLQVLEALPLPLQYCKGGREITSSCCSDRCTICLEDFMDGEFCRVFTCKHMFHSNCIDHWLKSHLTCPICRNSVVDT